MVGDVIDERFRVDREAAAGGMGRVFQAYDLHAGRAVALKVISGSSADSVERFERESVLLAELRHPGIVEYVAHGKLASGAPYLVMEWLKGV
ncbi:MAG: protein kinase, partial [Myxococcota bacterium]|nr:protein kinase [Myxococcota bacterium]